MESEKNILRGPVPSISLPADLSFGQLMLDRIASHGDSVALIDGETNEELTFAEILTKSLKLAVYLINEGLTEYDRIAVCSKNSLKYPIVICSGVFSGVANCPLNPDYTRTEHLRALNITRPKYIFASESVVENLSKIASELPWSPKVVCMGNCSVGEAPSMNDLIGSVEAPNPKTFKVRVSNPRDHVAAILYSSGTTGLPKGVMVTDSNYLALLCSMLEEGVGTDSTAATKEPPVALVLLPLFHSYAFVVMKMRLLFGSRAVMLSRFDPVQFLSTIEKYKIQTLVLVPPLLVFLAKSPLVERYDLSSVVDVWCGAAPLSPEIEKIVCKRLNVPKIGQAYGLTESTLGVLKNTSADPSKPGTALVLAPGVSGKVIPLDGSKEPLGPNERGELCFKADSIMKGYCGDANATAAAIDEDGWLHTGDIGYYDEDGYFFIVDRLKELIKYKGFQVPPAELEAVLLTHPNVIDAAVVGLPDEMCGELPLAFVVKQPGSNVTASEIEKFVNGQVSVQKWLRGGVRFIEAIPKTESGKILRRELRDSLKSKL